MDREGSKCCISCALLFVHGDVVVVVKLEVLEVWKEPSEIQDLSAGATGSFEGEELKCW